MRQRVFSVIENENGYKYQTSIFPLEDISNEVIYTAKKHGLSHYNSTVYDADCFNWIDVMRIQQTNPDEIPDEHLQDYVKLSIQ